MTDKKMNNNIDRKNKTTKKRPEDKGLMLSALKNFLIIFAVCLVLFGLTASFAVTLITATMDDILKDEKNELDSILNAVPDDAQTVVDDDDFEVPDGESFTSLFVVTDYNPDYFTYYPKGKALTQLKKDKSSHSMGVLGAGYKTVKARYIVIVRADKESREYTITPLASCTRVYTADGYKLLGDVYAAYGPEYFVKKVTALTGIGIDYYFFMNVTEAPALIKALGSFTVDLASDIYSDGASYGTKDAPYDKVTSALPPEEYLETEEETEKDDKDEEKYEDTEATDENGKKELSTYSVVVRKGTVNVTDSNIKALLMFENYENGITERCDLQYQIAKGALARMASLPEAEMIKLFEKLCSQTSYEDFEKGITEEDDKNTANTDKDKDKDEREPGIEDYYSDGFVNTDMTPEIFEKKTDLVAAYLKFSIIDLEFPGKLVGEQFIPTLTDGTTMMAEYKLPADPEKE